MFPEIPHATFSQLWQPTLLAVTLGLQLLYLLVTGPGTTWFSHGTGVPLWQKLCFLSGVGILYLAFGSPIDFLADGYLFSVHMVQHILEILVMVPLVIKGMPDWLIGSIVRRRRISSVWRFLTIPPVAIGVFGFTFSIFHLPLLYDWTLRNEAFHFFEHACFFVAALALWWPLLTPLPEQPRMSNGMKLLYIAWAYNITMPLNLFLLFSRTPWYAPYADAPRLFGLTALADQQLGAIIMAIGSFMAFVPIAAVSFYRYDPAVWYE